MHKNSSKIAHRRTTSFFKKCGEEDTKHLFQYRWKVHKVSRFTFLLINVILKMIFKILAPPPLLALDPPPFSSYKKYAEIWCLIIIYFSDLKCKIFNTNKSQSFILFPRAIKAFWLFLFYFSWELINRATVEIKRFRVFWNHGVSNSLRVWHSDRKKRLIHRW